MTHIMNMKAQFFAGIAVAVLALVGIWAYAGWDNTVEEGVPQKIVEEFVDGMREKVVSEVGQPIEGFEPFMFLQAYPSLKAQDFHNVDALIGLYRYEAGQVVYDLNGEEELHSAARAVSDEGMLQLLLNLATRLEVDLQSEGAVAEILTQLSQGSPTTGTVPAVPDSNQQTYTGTITCLPHKGSGPHTMECAFGLKAENGRYYGLQGLWEVAPGLTETEVQVRVVGSLREVSEDEKYDIEGVIEVWSAEAI